MLETKNETWFGFDEKFIEEKTFNDYTNSCFNKKPKCMIQHIDLSLYMAIANDSQCPYEFKIGEWVLTSGDCQSVEGVTIYPPFPDLGKAIDFSQENLKINHFVESP
jgi:hypothetical protein